MHAVFFHFIWNMHLLENLGTFIPQKYTHQVMKYLHIQIKRDEDVHINNIIHTNDIMALHNHTDNIHL